MVRYKKPGPGEGNTEHCQGRVQTSALRFFYSLCRFTLLAWVWLAWQPAQVYAQGQPDLFVGSIAVNPTVGPPGGNVDLTFELRNGGTSDAGPFNVSIYFSTTATLDVNKATLLHSLVVTGLKAGNASIHKATVTIPKQASANQVAYLAVMADSGTTVTETNESNNATSSTFNVKPGPDLTVDAVTLSKTVVVPGERISVVYTLKNVGRADVLPFETSIYFSNDALIDSNDTLMDRANVQYLRVANTLTLTRYITIASNTPTNQNYFIAVYVDALQQRSEEDENNNIKMIQIRVVPPSPNKYADFVVDSLTLIDKSQRLGQNVYYQAVYKNQGQGDGRFYAYLDYSTAADFRTTKTWTVVHNYTLKAGDTFTHNTYFQVPWQSPYDQAPKDYYVRIRLVSTTNEQLTSNNTGPTVIFKALEGQSNLNISGYDFNPKKCNYHLDTNNKVIEPKAATGQVTIHNQGYIVSEPVEVALYVSDDNKISNQDILIYKVTMPAINPQSSVTKNISFSFLATIPPGRYRFAVILDPDGKLTKDEGTRTREIWLHRSSEFVFSRDLPDLVIDKLVYTPSPKADVGTRINWEAWVRNKNSQPVNGCTFNTYTRVFFADDQNLTQVQFSSSNYGYPTAYVTKLTGYIDVPGTLAPRKGYLAFQLDTNDYHLDANKADNIKVIPFELLPRSVDLKIVSATSKPQTIPWEETVQVDVALTNQGTLKQVRGTRTCVWFSYDKTLEQQDVSLGSVYIDFGRVPSLTGSMTFKAQRWKEGPAYLILQVDCDDQYKESDENNNFFSIPITVRKFKLDFEPTSIKAAPNQIRPNLATTVEVEVRNNGPDKHIQRIGVCVYLSKDNVYDSKDLLFGCRDTTDIYDHFGTATFTLTGSANFLAGTHYIFARIDTGYSCTRGTSPYCSRDTYDETDEKNNEVSIPIFIRNDVDVTTGSLSVSKTIAKVGDNLTFRFQVKNIGTVGTNTPFDVLVVFSDNEVINKFDRVIKTIRIPALDANKTSADFNVSYAIPSSVQPGERYFGLIIDDKDEVYEVDETNNIGSVKINVLIPGVDLQVKNARIDRSVIPAGKASEVTIFSEVQNFGASSSAPFTVSYYLSTDQLYDPGDTLLGSRQYNQPLPSLAKTGQFVDKVKITLNQSNTFYVLVVADPANQIKETIKSNNTVALEIQIVNRPPRITSRPPVRAVEKQPYSYQGQAFDPDGDPLTWRIALGPVGMQVDAKTGQVTWTPQPFDGGKNVSVSLEVSDGRGGVAKQDFQISVQGVNDPPKIISVAPGRALAGQSFSYEPRASDPDTGDTLTWVIINAPTGMQIDTSTGKLTWQVPTILAGQKVTVTIQVSDQSGASDQQTFTLLIAKQNSPPSIVSQPPTVAFSNTTFRYQALASDPDTGDTLSWSRVSGPTGLTIDSATGLVEWKVPVLTNQSVDVTIRVSDQAGASVDQKFTLKISRNNTAPKIVSKPPTAAFVGRLFQYRPVATDPDVGDQLAWSLIKGPAGVTFDKATGEITWTPPQNLKDQTVEFSIQVVDIGNLTDTQTFTLKVGQYCEVDSDCSSSQLCLRNLCSPPGCFKDGCKDPNKPICSADGTCQPDLCANVTCTGGEFCLQGSCVPVCAYVTCNTGEECLNGQCAANPCDKVTCQQGQRCDSNGKCVRDACTSGKCGYNRKCVAGICQPDPCANVKCPGSKMICEPNLRDGSPQCVLPAPCKVDAQCNGDLICEAGVCAPPQCYDSNKPCATGEICLRGRCVKHPCDGKSCSNRQFCRDGRCVDVCAGVSCQAGQQCVDGRCVSDSCAAANCNPGETCVKGICEKNLCVQGQSCKYTRVCANNACQQDPCLYVKCPISTQRCVNGQCTDPPACQLDYECSDAQICVRGRCIPSQCEPSKPCATGEICEDGRCRKNPCEGQTCGGNTFCREGLCVGSCSGVFCGSTQWCQFGLCRPDPCDGIKCSKDEVCLKGQCRKDICAQSAKPCKHGRVCSPDGCLDSLCKHASCPQGQTCDPKNGQCYGDVTCSVDIDCPSGGICEGGKCVAAGCYQESCPQGQVCWQGKCQQPACAGKQCGADQYCNEQGQCTATCSCQEGQRCGATGCEKDPCAGVTCKPEQLCVEGKCEDRCKNNACKFGRICIPGSGCHQDPCASTTCPQGSVCRRGYCVDPCTGLRCPTGTGCQAGQCITLPGEEPSVQEPSPEPPTEKADEPIIVDKTNTSQEPGPEPTSNKPDASQPEPEGYELPPVPGGCNCQASTGGGAMLLWLGLLMLLGWRRKA